jgi:hypothetical protein
MEFRDARGRAKYHTPKNLAISVEVELEKEQSQR